MALTDILSAQQNELIASFLEPVAGPFRDIQDSIQGAKTDVTDSVLGLFGVTSSEDDPSEEKNKNKLIRDASKSLAKQAVISLFTGGS